MICIKGRGFNSADWLLMSEILLRGAKQAREEGNERIWKILFKASGYCARQGLGE